MPKRYSRLLDHETLNVNHQFESTSSYPPYYFKKTCVIMPCKDRGEYLRRSLPHWLSQTYKRFEIILIDYNSEEHILKWVEPVAEQFGVKVDVEPDPSKRYDEYNKISLFRMEAVEGWNMSHALNYGIHRANCDVLTIAGCDTIPDPRYLDTVLTILNDNVIPVVWWGRITFPRKYWEMVNGYQEICDRWGFEDVDFRGRMTAALDCQIVEISRDYCPCIRHFNGEVRDYDGNSINRKKCASYYRMYGYIGNYGIPPGDVMPVPFVGDIKELVVHIARLKNPLEDSDVRLARKNWYADELNPTTLYCIVPKDVDRIPPFMKSLDKNIKDTEKRIVTKPIWELMREVKEGTLIDANF